MREQSPLITALMALTCATAGAGDLPPAVASAPAARAEVVRLDVVVTDAQGMPVSDLTRDDFEVLEDGKPQRVTAFVFAGRKSARKATVTAAGAGQPEPAPDAEQGQGRRIAIVVDELHLSRRSVEAAKHALLQFLNEIASPDDEIALVVVDSPAATVQLTRDRAALRQGIARIRDRQDSIVTGQGAQLTPEQAEQILRGDGFSLQLAARLLMDEPGSPYSGRFVPRQLASGPTPPGVEPSEKAAALDAQKQARGILSEALAFSEVTLGTLERVLRRMTYLSGRKLCLFVSDGFLVGRGTTEERTEKLSQVVAAATRSRAAVYPLVGVGLASIGGDAAAVGGAGPAGLRDRVARMGERQTLSTLEGLADDTGGFVVRGAGSLAAGLTRALNDREAAYLLAYEPHNQKRDGRFRRLTVRLPRHRDYVVRTRKGYFAPEAGKRAQEARRNGRAAGPLSSEEAELALVSPIPEGGVPVHLAAPYLELAPAGSQVIVEAQLGPEGLDWEDADRRQRTELDLVGGVFDASGNPVGRPFAGRHYAFDLAPQEYDAFKATGLRFQQRVALKPGHYEVRVLALDQDHALLGGAAQVVDIPDLAEKKLALSSVFLSASTSAASGGATEARRDAQVLRRFKRSDTLYFQLYVYNAARDESGAGDVVIQTQIHADGRVLFASKPQQARLQQEDGVPLPEGNGVPLSGLAPGSYDLRVVVADRRAKTIASRSVDFAVE